MPKGKDKALYRWQRPSERYPGWTLGTAVVFPPEEIVDTGLVIEEPQGICWLPSSTSEAWTVLSVWLSAPSVGGKDWPGRRAHDARLVFRSALANGEHVCLILQTEQPGPAMIADFAAKRADAARAAAPLHDQIDPSVEELRAALTATDDSDGTPYFYEVALARR